MNQAISFRPTHIQNVKYGDVSCNQSLQDSGISFAGIITQIGCADYSRTRPLIMGWTRSRNNL